jgi:enoyl-CoA hydratase
MIGTYAGMEVSVEAGVAVLTLSRPHALNAPDRAMHTALTRVWGDLDADGVNAVVLTGSGRAFSAGSDRTLMRALLDDEKVRAEVMAEASVMLRQLVELPIPIVAAVNGVAVGLACGMVAVCDLVVMAESAYFVDPHVPLGLAGGDGMALLWPKCIGLLVTKELALLGSRLDAQRALELGIANRVVADADLMPEAMSLARRLAALPPQAVRETKRVLNAALRRHLEVGLDIALASEARSFKIPENRAALERALERRPAQSDRSPAAGRTA